jgi:hypothetical protein
MGNWANYFAQKIKARKHYQITLFHVLCNISKKMRFFSFGRWAKLFRPQNWAPFSAKSYPLLYC